MCCIIMTNLVAVEVDHIGSGKCTRMKATLLVLSYSFVAVANIIKIFLE